MKKIIILTVTIFAAAFSTVSAQVTPPGAGDKDLRDTNVKGRSNELERIDRDVRKDAKKKKGKSTETPAPAEQPEDKLAARYEEIKTDFEQIQKSQDFVINSYKSSEKIDYAQIGKSSMEISKSATRLASNLFPPTSVENIEKKTEGNPVEESKTSKTVREIIVELDNTIGSFATSQMFQNLRTVDPKVSEKTKIDLERIVKLSRLLGAEAGKMTKTN